MKKKAAILVLVYCLGICLLLCQLRPNPRQKRITVLYTHRDTHTTQARPLSPYKIHQNTVRRILVEENPLPPFLREPYAIIPDRQTLIDKSKVRVCLLVSAITTATPISNAILPQDPAPHPHPHPTQSSLKDTFPNAPKHFRPRTKVAG